MNDEILDHGIRNITPGDKAKCLRLTRENISHNKRIRNGRIVLFILSVLVIIGAVLIIKQLNERVYSLVSAQEIYLRLGLLLLVYIGSFIYSFVNPLYAFIVATIVFVFSQLYGFSLTQSMSMFGVIMRMSVIIFFGVAIKSCLEIKKNNEFISNLGINLDEEIDFK